MVLGGSMKLRRAGVIALAATLAWAAAGDATSAGAAATTVPATTVPTTTVPATTTVAAPSNVEAKRPAKSTLLVLGDSLTWGSNYFSKAQSRLAASGTFDTVVVDGWWSRRIGGIISTTYSGNNTYKKLVSSGLRPTAVIVALGTNDVFFMSKRREYAALIRELMTTIGNIPVVWVNVHRVDTPSNVNRSRLFNTTLERTLAEYPLASIFDWSGLAKQNPAVMAWDKIHHSAYGYEVRTKTYLDLATVLSQRVVSLTTTTTSAVPTTVPATTVPVTSVAP
ncbi:MAG: SGNH/GDSL hydrolase family protein [Actinobacteria bacterium]|nr:SGNH/GDSL hydrolase family protein [Actinomycetota bacterium]